MNIHTDRKKKLLNLHAEQVKLLDHHACPVKLLDHYSGPVELLSQYRGPVKFLDCQRGPGENSGPLHGSGESNRSSNGIRKQKGVESNSPIFRMTRHCKCAAMDNLNLHSTHQNIDKLEGTSYEI